MTSDYCPLHVMAGIHCDTWEQIPGNARQMGTVALATRRAQAPVRQFETMVHRDALDRECILIRHACTDAEDRQKAPVPELIP
jgi:hypothetical protein